MNTKQPRSRARALAGALFGLTAATLVGCSEVPGGNDDREPASLAEAPLAGAPIGGAFALQDANGDTVTNDSLKGRWRLVYFGYTFCPDVCPVDTARMGRAYAEIEAAAPDLAERLVPMFVTIDPERDTPEVAGAFAANFHPAMLGLSGSQEAVRAAADTYRVFAQKGEAREDGFYLMDHSAQIYLMGPDGEPVNAYARDVPADAIAADVQRWMSV